MIHKWKKKLQQGKEGENLLVKTYPNLFKLYEDGDEYDLDIIQTDKTLEVKTEYYSIIPGQPRHSLNFFMEIISDTYSGKLGGPYRAAKDGIDYFLSFFILDKTIFWFNDVPALAQRVRSLSPNFVVKNVKNEGWITQGYAMPRELFKDLFIQIPLGMDHEEFYK